MNRKVSATWLGVLLSILLALSPTATLAQSGSSNIPVVTVSPSIFPIGESSSLFLSVTNGNTQQNNGNAQQNKNIQSGDAFKFTLGAASGTGLALESAVLVNSSSLSAGDFDVAIDPANKQVAVTYRGATRPFPSGDVFSIKVSFVAPNQIGPGKITAEGPSTSRYSADGNDKYLLELFAVYYAPSLQVLREMKKRSHALTAAPMSKSECQKTSYDSPAQTTHELYAIGNPALGGEALARALTQRNAAFDPLPETEKEVQSLATEVYGPKASAVRIGAAAQEDAVKAEIGKYRVLHFATHGVLDNQNPLYSYIVLAQSNDSKQDGLLEAWELMEMDLKAELAVLSACDTARGRIGDGEGMVGMTWALFVAGVPTTVASQWQVPSESTSRLMLGFHKTLSNLTDGRKISTAAAWRQAAMAMTRDPRYRTKPYYWAGFVVIGDGGR